MALLASGPGQKATDAGTAWAAGKGAKTKIMIEKVVKSDEEWKKILTPEQYQILRGHATEPPGSCALNTEKRAGTFSCAAEQCLGLLKSELDFGRVDAILSTGLHEFLDGLQLKMNKVDECIVSDFFAPWPVAHAMAV